jgi:starch synthase
MVVFGWAAAGRGGSIKVMRPLRILFATPEVEPFVKAGGLGDMVGALPKELAALGHDVRIVCPLYGSVKRVGEWQERPAPLGVEVGPEALWAKVWETTLPGAPVPVYFIEHDWLFGRREVYSSWPDNPYRFAFLSRAALTVCEQLEWIPEVIHCHDWTVGLLPVMLNTILRDRPIALAATVFTIHNLEYQGYGPRGVVDFARLPWSEFRADSIESHGQVNMMKAGLYHSTKLTTVSPTYAQEIRTPAGGFGLDQVLRYRGADLLGIVNGIDTGTWNPATDPNLPANYSVTDLAGKAVCKRALQEKLGLAVDARIPLFGVVSRFAGQKGLDLLAAVLPRVLADMNVQFAILGSGEPELEVAYRAMAAEYPGRVGAHIGFDAGLARLIQAGADVFVMPSRTEPCGLTQMYSMRYGTPPLVRATGGLIDTVENYVEGGNTGTGFIFKDETVNALHGTIGWACSTYYDRPAEFAGLQQRGMAKNFAWSISAEQYVNVYRWAISARALVGET